MNPDRRFSLIEILLLLSIITALAVAYIMNNGMYKKTKQNVVVIPTSQPLPTDITQPISPSVPQKQTQVEQCISDSNCGRCKTCQEGLCVLEPTCSNQDDTTIINPTPTPAILNCPQGLVKVCQAGICECLNN